METPYAGRAIISNSYNEMVITIPAKRNLLLIIFLSFWLCVWLTGEFFALTGLKGFRPGAPNLFSLVWGCGWTVAGIFAIATLWWNIAGKEVITISQGVLTIDKRGAIFKRYKRYDLNEAKNFRSYEEPGNDSPFGARSSNSLVNIAANGTIKFDYGMETVKFGDRLYQAEGEYIVEKLRNKKLIR